MTELTSLFRRTLLLGALSTGVAGLVPALATAQSDFPTKSITLVVPYAAGGGTDLIARMIAENMGNQLDQTVVVENREGAGGVVGTSAVARSKADGYTLVFLTTSSVIQPPGGEALPYDIVKDFAPVGLVGASPSLIVVDADSPIASFEQLVEEAKAAPGAMSYGSAGVNSFANLGMEQVLKVAGIKMKHVPYRGTAPAIADVMGGTLVANLASYASVRGLIEDGELRALVVAGDVRSAPLPDVPSTAELGYPEAKIELWWGLAAPAGTPPEVIERLNAALNASLAQPDVSERLVQEAAVPMPVTAEAAGALVAAEVTRWLEIVKAP